MREADEKSKSRNKTFKHVARVMMNSMKSTTTAKQIINAMQYKSKLHKLRKNAEDELKKVMLMETIPDGSCFSLVLDNELAKFFEDFGDEPPTPVFKAEMDHVRELVDNLREKRAQLNDP